MADISMCLGRGCLVRDRCYRYRAVPEKADQSYGFFDADVTEDNQDCDYFWPLEKAEGPITFPGPDDPEAADKG